MFKAIYKSNIIFPDLKTSTTTVRTAYIDCMNACFNSSNLKQASPIVETLVSVLDKGGSGNKTAQLESLSAACLLMRLATSGVCPDRHANTLWNIVLDMDKQHFVSEKFLAAATENGELKKDFLKDGKHLSIN